MSKASEKLNALVAEFAEDHDKFEEKTNNSAATRARKKLMEIIKCCKEMRDEIQAARNDEKKAA